MTVDMNTLWKLQTIESAARALEDGLSRMPQAIERAKKEQEIREGALKAREAEGAELVKKRRGLEKDIEAAEQKIRENATRQGSAKTNAELDAFKREAQFMKEQKSGLETQVLEFFDQEEAHQEKVRQAQEEVARAKTATASRQKEMDQRAAGDKAELEKLRAEYGEVAVLLPAPVRSRFEQVARAKNGVAVVPVQRGACGGCFNALPPQFVNEVRKAERIMVCEGCGRIVIWTDGSAEA